jgi:cephalosporin-C deacetylase
VIEHLFPFDPTYGYDKAKLLTVPAPEGPADFAGFWKRTYEEARAIPLDVQHRRIEGPRNDYETREIEFNSLGGVRIGGWVTIPKRGSIKRGIVEGHGYDGRDTPAYQPDAITISPCARGFHRSARPDISCEAFRHVLHGIQSRETYSHRGCAADLWNAASALLEIYPELAGQLHYWGSSFGGGVGALALPWDNRFKKAFLEVPSFGNHPLRVTLPCVGSGEAVRSYKRRHPEVMDVLAYFDAATAARFIKIPVFASLALFDPAVPPPGQFAVYNALAGPKTLFVRTTGHFPSPLEDAESAEMQKQLLEWWDKP